MKDEMKDVKKLPLLMDQKKLDEITAKAEDFKTHPMFSSSRGVAAAAVAEFLANSEGFTLYDFSEETDRHRHSR